MSTRLEIAFTPGEGAVVRMLGLVERRGFDIRAVAMRKTQDSASLSLEVEPREATRDILVVARQLSRLVDVQLVIVPTAAAGIVK